MSSSSTIVQTTTETKGRKTKKDAKKTSNKMEPKAPKQGPKKGKPKGEKPKNPKTKTKADTCDPDKYFLLGEVKPNTGDGYFNSFTFGLNPKTVANLCRDPLMLAFTRSHKMFTFEWIKVRLVPLASNTVVAGTTAQIGLWDDPTGTGPENQNAASRNGCPAPLGRVTNCTFRSRNKRQFNLSDQEDQKETTPGLIYVTLYGKTVSGFTGQQYEGSLFQIWVCYKAKYHVPSDNMSEPIVTVASGSGTIEKNGEEVLLKTTAPLPTGKRMKNRDGTNSFKSSINRLSGLAGPLVAALPPPWGEILGAGCMFIKWMTSTKRLGATEHTYKIYSSMENAEEDYQQPTSEFPHTPVTLVGPVEQLTHWDDGLPLSDEGGTNPELPLPGHLTEMGLNWTPSYNAVVHVHFTPYQTDGHDVTDEPKTAKWYKPFNFVATAPTFDTPPSVTIRCIVPQGGETHEGDANVLIEPWYCDSRTYSERWTADYAWRNMVEFYEEGKSDPLIPSARWTFYRLFKVLSQNSSFYNVKALTESGTENAIWCSMLGGQAPYMGYAGSYAGFLAIDSLTNKWMDWGFLIISGKVFIQAHQPDGVARSLLTGCTPSMTASGWRFQSEEETGDIEDEIEKLEKQLAAVTHRERLEQRRKLLRRMLEGKEATGDDHDVDPSDSDDESTGTVGVGNPFLPE